MAKPFPSCLIAPSRAQSVSGRPTYVFQHAHPIIREFPPPLAGFDQRTTSELLGKPGVDEQLPGYDRWWACPQCKYEQHPSTFPEYMVWLERNLRNGTLAWWHDPTITHFRPATMFTHGPTGSRP